MKKNTRRLLSMLIVLTMALSMLPMISFAADPITYVFCLAPDSWTTCKIHWWGSSEIPDTTWPGVDMSKDSRGIWAIDVPSDADGLVINNGSGIQSVDLDVPTGSKNMFIFTKGTWELYGVQFFPPAPLYTVYCQAPDVWTTCNVYWWGSITQDNPEWPGVAMSKDGDLWTGTVPADATGVVFSNDLGVQSDDMAPPAENGQLYTLEADRYFVAGDFNEWVENDEAYEMTAQEDGSYALTFSLPAGVYGLKVTDGTWEYSWGIGEDDRGEAFNYMINVVEDGQITVTFGNDYSVSVTGDCLGEYTPGETVTVSLWLPDYADSCNIYWWGSTTHENPEWPGIAMTHNEDGYWTYDVPSDAEGMIFNWCNTYLQSYDLMIPPYDYSYAYADPWLYIAGDFTDWAYLEGMEMVPNSDGTSSLTMSMAPGDYQLGLYGNDDALWLGSYYSFNVSEECDVTVTYTYNTAELLITGDHVQVTAVIPSTEPEPIVIESLHAVGMSGLMGVDWDPTANEMYDVDGVYFITFENVAAGTYEYKFAANGSWDLSWTTACETESDVVYDLLFNTPLNNTVTVSEDNSTVTLFVDLDYMDPITGEGAVCMAVVEPPVSGVTVSGSVTTGTDGETTVELMDAEGTIAAEFLEGKTGSYSFDNIPAGTYTLVVSKENHTTREYELVVGDEDVSLDAKIHQVGDVNGDGRINVGDVSRVYAFIKKNGTLNDYEQLCADVSNDNRINVGDVSRIYGHIKKTSSLW